MDRSQEIKTLYTVITFIWEAMKKYDYRNMTETSWDELIKEVEDKFQDLKKIDAPIAYLYEHMMFTVIDYMTPGKREEWEKRKLL